MCETDYSGYPDCRDDTVKAMQVALTLGLDKRVAIHTPLMWIDKAATFAMAEEIGGQPCSISLSRTPIAATWATARTRHDWGYGCGECPACQLRAQGFATFMSRRTKTDMTDIDKQKNIEGVIFLVLFCLTIPLANWMIGHVGTVCVAQRAVPASRSRPASWRRPAC